MSRKESTRAASGPGAARNVEESADSQQNDKWMPRSQKEAALIRRGRMQKPGPIQAREKGNTRSNEPKRATRGTAREETEQWPRSSRQ